jgi:hypothetical protein
VLKMHKNGSVTGGWRSRHGDRGEWGSGDGATVYRLMAGRGRDGLVGSEWIILYCGMDGGHTLGERKCCVCLLDSRLV